MEQYAGYRITPAPRIERNGRWSVAVVIAPSDEPHRHATYRADDGIAYILREEAEKEALNLARNLIARGIVR